jgi:VWFA-related protein
MIAVSSASTARATDPVEPADPVSGVRTVHLDAIATDARGRTVADLKADEIQILENGAPLPIEAVRFVRLVKAVDGRGSETTAGAEPIQSSAEEQRAAAAGAGRLVAIFLDDYHVDAGAAAATRDALTAFVKQELGPRDLAVVARPLDSLLTFRLTRDRDAMARAIAAFEGRQAIYEPRSPLERSLMAGSPERAAALRAQIVTSALNALALHLGRLNAHRKTLIFVSEGFTTLPVQRGAGLLPTLDGVIRSANQARVSIYPIDPRALLDVPSFSDRAAARASLQQLATETDGFAILEVADRAEGFRRIAADSSEHYLVTFRASSAPDGRFHRVQLRVSRQGVRVRARRGYWAPTVEESLARRLAGAAGSTVPTTPRRMARRASPLIRPWFGWARGDDGLARVSFVWEPANRPSAAAPRIPSPTRVSLKAVGADGNTIFEGRVRPRTAGVPAAGEEPVQAVFGAPPGQLRVEISIEDSQARIIDTDVRDVTVGRADGPVAFGSVEVLRLRHAREFRAAAADPIAPPVAGREFTRADRLLIRVPAYGSDAVSARLVSRLGKVMRELAVGPGPRPDLYQIDLPLAALAIGEYRVELVAASSAGRAVERLAFRVVP